MKRSEVLEELYRTYPAEFARLVAIGAIEDNPVLKLDQLKRKRGGGMKEIYIAGNVPSSKNSKRVIWRGRNPKTGNPIPAIIDSKPVVRYRATYGQQFGYASNVAEFERQKKGKKKPYLLAFYFVRLTRGKFDYINLAQLPQDLMSQYGWIEDDDWKNVVPYFAGHHVAKGKEGLFIRLLNDPSELEDFRRSCETAEI